MRVVGQCEPMTKKGEANWGSPIWRREIWSVKYCLPKENKILVLALLVEV